MIRIHLIDDSSGTIQSGGQELLQAWSRETHTLWIDLEDEPAGPERALLADTFGINALAIDDAQRKRHPPKIEFFDKYLFMLLKGFSAETNSIDFSVIHISFFCGRNFLITRHAEVSPSVNAVWKALEDGRFEGERSAPRLLYRVVRTIIDRYSPIVLNLEARLEELEEQMLENARDEILAELVTYNSRLRKLRRIFGYQQAVLGELKNDGGPLLGESCQHEFQDAYEQMERMASLSEMLQHLTGDLINGYISVASHHLNNIMKTLTIASVIFLPLTFVAGIYGMNFENMPELSSRDGYFIVIGVMVFIATSLLFVFRRKRWL